MMILRAQESGLVKAWAPRKGSWCVGAGGTPRGRCAHRLIMCMLLANLIIMFTDALGGAAFLGYALWVLVGIICGWLFARTPACWCSAWAWRVSTSPVSAWDSGARQRAPSTGFLFPAAMVDTDGRGIHDRATGTAVIMV